MRPVFLTALLIALLAACGGRKQKPVKLPPPMPAVIGATQQGIASWYGHPYHGRRTSNGEVYDMNKQTAAHLALPFNTWVRVTNLNNNRDTEVRINDRGPFVKNRIIDLSRAAAEEIEMIGPGTARVRLEVIEAPEAHETSGAYVVQVGSFGRRDNAEAVMADINRLGYVAAIEVAETAAGARYRVLVTPADPNGADAVLTELREEGFEGFVRSLNPDVE